MTNEVSGALDADVAVTLYRGVPLEEQLPYVRWSGWRTRKWPLKYLARGLRIYGFDTVTRTFTVLLEATHAGWFEYTSWRSFAANVAKVGRWSPDPQSQHREKMHFGHADAPYIGYVIQCDLVRRVSIPWNGRVPPIGWIRIRDTSPLPPAKDAVAPPRRVRTSTSRIIRDTAMTTRLKAVHRDSCQLCGDVLTLEDGRTYSEAHHLKPLGGRHRGPDTPGNILVPCPNCHALCDMGGIGIDHRKLRAVDGHVVDQRFVNYHNGHICG